jgi:hypothetical protein
MFGIDDLEREKRRKPETHIIQKVEGYPISDLHFNPFSNQHSYFKSTFTERPFLKLLKTRKIL